MHSRSRVNYFLAFIAIIILVLSVLVVPTTQALPTAAAPVNGSDKRSTDNNQPPRSIFRQLLGELADRRLAPMIADITKPHMKTGYRRRRYRGVHH